jgi:hypothetical protein
MLDANELREKIKRQDRSEFSDELVAEMDGWIARLDQVEALRVLAENFIIQDMVKLYTSMIGDMDIVLLTNRKLSELDRLNLLDRKSLYKGFIDSFDADRQLEKLGKEINDNLEPT